MKIGRGDYYRYISGWLIIDIYLYINFPDENDRTIVTIEAFEMLQQQVVQQNETIEQLQQQVQKLENFNQQLLRLIHKDTQYLQQKTEALTTLLTDANF